MRILYHHRTRGKNVEGVHIREIVKALRALNHKVHVASPQGVDPMTPSVEGEDKAGKVWSLVSRFCPQLIFEILEILYNFSGYFRIREALNEHAAEAIYERYAFFMWIGVYMAKKNGIPIILEVNEVSSIKRVRKQVLVPLAKTIERRIFEKADAIVVVSDFLKDHIAGEMSICQDKIHIVPNAVDPKKFNPDVSGADIREKLGLTGRLVMGFVGSFVSWSHLDFLIKVFGEIAEDYQNVHLMLVGDGPEREKMEGIVESENLSDMITFTGSVTHADVPKFVAAMDICIIPWSNEYRSPVKLFEYMAMAKPVVAPRLKPIEKVIIHEKNGVLFTQDHGSSMKDAIIHLVENEKEREKIASRSWQTILENHIWQKNAEKVVEIYQAALARNRGN